MRELPGNSRNNIAQTKKKVGLPEVESSKTESQLRRTTFATKINPAIT